MAEGFARDVTVPISIPQVQAPDFTSNRSTAEDVVDVLGFGLQVKQTLDAKAAEAERKKQLSQVQTSVDSLFSKYQTISDQKGAAAANRVVFGDIVKLGNPALSGTISSMLSERINQAQTGIPSTRSTTKELKTALTPEQDRAARVVAGIPLTGGLETATPEQLAAYETEGDKLAADEAALKANTQLASTNDAKGKAALIDMKGSVNKFISRQLSVVANNMFDTFRDTSNIDSPAKQKELIDQIKQNVDLLSNSTEQFINGLYADIPDSVEKERAIADHKGNIKTLMSLFSSENFDTLKNNATTLDFLTSKLKLDLFQGGNVAFRLKQIYGERMPELVMTNLSQLKGGDLVKNLESAIEDTFFMTEQQKSAFSLEKYVGYVSGVDKIESAGDLLPKEVKAAMYKDSFTFFKDLSSTGAILEQDKDTTDKLLGGITFLLEDGNKEKPTQAIQIVSFLNNPNTQEALKKADPRRKEAIDNLAITYSKTYLTNSADGALVQLNSLASSGVPITFNVATGQFSTEAKIAPVTGTSFSGLNVGDSVAREQNKQAKRVVEQANKALDVYKRSVTSNPTLSGFNQSEQISWLLTQGSGVGLGKNIQVEGTLPPLPEETDQALKNRVSVEEQRRKIEEIKQKGTIEEQVKSQSKAVEKLRGLLIDVGAGKVSPEELKNIDLASFGIQ